MAEKEMANVSAQMQRPHSQVHRPAEVPKGAEPSRRRLVIWGGALIVLALGLWGYRALTTCRVLVVSGLNASYTTELNGKRLYLGPYGHAWLTLRRGAVHVKSSGPGLSIPDETVEVRPKGGETVIINPDGCAMLTVIEVTYTALPVSTGSSWKQHAGRSVHHVGRVDYFFEEPPREIENSENRNSAIKFQLYQRTDVNDPHGWLSRAGSFLEAHARLVGRRIEVDPTFGIESLVNDDLFTRARPFLDRRPLRVEYHMKYQNRRGFVFPSAANPVESEYRKLVAERPDDPAAIFLLARVTPSAQERSTLMGKVMNHPEIGPLAKKELDRAGRTRRWDPKHGVFRDE